MPILILNLTLGSNTKAKTKATNFQAKSNTRARVLAPELNTVLMIGTRTHLNDSLV